MGLSAAIRLAVEPWSRKKYFNLWPEVYVLPWLVPAFTSLYLKYVLMAGAISYDSGGFRIAAQSLGREQGLTIWEKLWFFQWDIIVAATIPLALILIVRFLPVRWRILCVGVFSAFVTLALYIQLRAFREVGQFISFDMLATAVRWGLLEPNAYKSHLHLSRLLLLNAAGLAITVYFGWLLQNRATHAVQSHRSKILRGSPDVLRFCIFCLIPVGLAVCLPPLPIASYHSSVLLKALSAYWGDSEKIPGAAEFVSLKPESLRLRYEDSVHASPHKKDPAFWGKEQGNNVLLLVLETTPYRFLPLDGELSDFPNLETLRRTSFVGLNHNTTFPRTHEAVFSILSSWYPSDVTRTFEEQHPNSKVPGIMRVLSEHGYATAVYSPMRRWKSYDEEMFQELGVQRQVYPPDSLVPPPGPLRDEWQRSRITRDLAALQLMKHDLTQTLAQGKPFAFAFLPQIGHIPYPDVPQNQGETDLRRRARGILQVQDAWLGEVLQILRQYHQLDKTIIVVAGDHGVRTSEEDPAFRSGTIDEYSFHVPLLIYAPRTLHHPVPVSTLTSHIDIVPTVLDLLGIGASQGFEEGSPIWDTNLANRQTYFLAATVFGADGYYSNGRYYMRNVMSDTVYESDVPHFDSGDIVPDTVPQHDGVALAIARMTGLQEVVAAHSGQNRNR